MVIVAGQTSGTYRPGAIKSELAVRSARPRDPSGAAFNGLKRDLTQLVMEEQHRFMRAEYEGIPPGNS